MCGEIGEILVRGAYTTERFASCADPTGFADEHVDALCHLAEKLTGPAVAEEVLRAGIQGRLDQETALSDKET